MCVLPAETETHDVRLREIAKLLQQEAAEAAKREAKLQRAATSAKKAEEAKAKAVAREERKALRVAEAAAQAAAPRKRRRIPQPALPAVDAGVVCPASESPLAGQKRSAASAEADAAKAAPIMLKIVRKKPRVEGSD